MKERPSPSSPRRPPAPFLCSAVTRSTPSSPGRRRWSQAPAVVRIGGAPRYLLRRRAGGVRPPAGRYLTFQERSSGGRGKRVGSPPFGIPRVSPRIGPARPRGDPRRAEPIGHLDGIEAQARPRPATQPEGTEVLRVVIDPAPRDPPATGDLGGAQHAPVAHLGRGGGGAVDQLGESARQRLDRLGRQVHLLWCGAHRRLAKGRGALGPGPACREWWSIRALAISR